MYFISLAYWKGGEPNNLCERFTYTIELSLGGYTDRSLSGCIVGMGRNAGLIGLCKTRSMALGEVEFRTADIWKKREKDNYGKMQRFSGFCHITFLCDIQIY